MVIAQGRQESGEYKMTELLPVKNNDEHSDKIWRLQAVQHARQALAKIDNPDFRSVNACDVAERFAHGNATIAELDAAWAAAWAVAWKISSSDFDAAWAAMRSAVGSAARAEWLGVEWIGK